MGRALQEVLRRLQAPTGTARPRLRAEQGHERHPAQLRGKKSEGAVQRQQTPLGKESGERDQALQRKKRGEEGEQGD